MKKIFYILSTAVFMFWGTPVLAVGLSAYNYLQDIETSSSEDEIKIALNFSKPIKDVWKPQFFEKSIQFTFNKTYVKPAKKTFNIGEELISDVHIYQFDKNSVRLRLLIGKKDIWDEDRLTYEKKGNQLVISVSKKNTDLLNDMYEENLSSPAVEIKENYNRPVELLSNTIYQEDLIPIIYDKADENKVSLNVNKNKKNTVSNNIAGPTFFSSSIKVVTALMIVLSLILVTYYFVKKYLLKDGSLLGMDKQVKVISTSYIAPKKNITLVEVAGEILVLGVTAANINLLTKIENKDAAKRIKEKKESRLANWKKNKQTVSSFSRQLDAYTSKASDKDKKNSSIKVINRLIEEKIDKLKTV